MKRIFAYGLGIGIILIASCSKPSLKIIYHEKLIADIQKFPKEDTTIQVGNVFVQYHKENQWLVGKVEDVTTLQKGNFRSSNKAVYVEIEDDKFIINF